MLANKEVDMLREVGALKAFCQQCMHTELTRKFSERTLSMKRQNYAMRINIVFFTTLCLTLLFVHSSQAVPEPGQKSFANSIGMEFVHIPAGSFPVTDGDGKAAGTATVSKPFYLCKYPVTQKEWEAAMGNNPSTFKGSDRPVENVSWYDAQKFIRRLNAKEGTGGYRLPTEMEWELAARGGTVTRWFFGQGPKNPKDMESRLGAYAWFAKNSGKTTKPVGKKKPNPYGLHDIYGNVHEWVQDWYNDLPELGEFTDYRGPATGLQRAARGCAWHNRADDCASDVRGGISANIRSNSTGFRLAFSSEAADTGVVEIPLWSHHEKNYEIYSPQLSPDNKWLVFTRMLYSPDGHAAEQFSETELEQLRKRIKENPRIADPEVMLVNMADKSARFIDYGWDPVFSPDQKSILYAHQTKPASGYRLVASTLAGNEIRVYDMERQNITTVARPAFGYLSDPAFSDKGAILFGLSDATNGAWGGTIGVGTADPLTGQQNVLLAPTKERGLYHQVRKFAMHDDVCWVLRARPLSAGTYVADTYAFELVEADKGVLYSWGEHDSSAWAWVDFRRCPSGVGLEVYDGEWKSPLSAIAAQRQQAKVPAGHSSPDCASVATLSEDGEALTILSSRGAATRRWVAPGYIRSLAWSPDASHIALVLSQSEHYIDSRFEYDELLVVRVGDLPHNAQEVSEAARCCLRR